MNLADAIRQASQSTGATPLTAPAAPAPVPETGRTTAAVQAPAQKEGSRMKEPTAPQLEISPATNTVRLEIVLSPEQLSNLFRAIVAGQHSVMTLREAAAYLRLPSATVDQMAVDGKLPAFSIDGKWRFSHSALEEWMSARQADETPQSKAVGA